MLEIVALYLLVITAILLDPDGDPRPGRVLQGPLASAARLARAICPGGTTCRSIASSWR